MNAVPTSPSNKLASWRRPTSLLLMAASGFAGLGYQIVWTQQCALWLGHEAASVLAVVTAFFGGMAAGALVLGRYIENSARPVAWYAGCELLIAIWSLWLAMMMPSFSAWLLSLTGMQPAPWWQWTVAFFGTFLLLLPATAAMGATLPAMARATTPLLTETRSIAPLYASNTFGAVLGVLTIAFWLIPEFGLLDTAIVCVVLNTLCGAAALKLFATTYAPMSHATANSGLQTQGIIVRLVLTGLLGIGYEMLVVRVLSQVAEDTVYTFAMLLAVYLVGSAAGAAAYERWSKRSRDAKNIDDLLLCVLAAACMAGAASLWFAEQLKTAALHMFGASMGSAIAAEAMLALAAFGPPTIMMGALFSHLSKRANASGIGFGQALGANTLGAAAAPVIVGVLALPKLGPKLALLLICIGYLALTTRRTWRTAHFMVPASAVLAMMLWASPLAFIDIPQGGHVISYREGIMAAVSVVEDASGVAVLRINNRQQEGSSSTLRVDARQALLPILLHPMPERALFLGLGTGVTASAAAEFPGLQVDAVELLPEVIDASAHFTHAATGTGNPHLHIVAADARRYVRTSSQRYDVIVSDNFHPARSGSGSLYTVEHFAAVRNRLDAGGIFCQWLPLHQLDLETLRSIVRSFMSVYPHGWAMLASNSLETPVLALVGRKDNERFDIAVLRAHLSTVVLPKKLTAIGIEDEFALLGSFVAGPTSLRRFADNAALNTDDRPVVAYRAPQTTYAPDSLPRDRLIALLREVSIEPADLLATTHDAALPQRLAAYWKARDRFIESGRDVQPSANVREMLARVREPLLSVLRISPDFRPAYDPLLRMATLLAKTDVDSATALLAELARIQSTRFEAHQVVQQIPAAP